MTALLVALALLAGTGGAALVLGGRARLATAIATAGVAGAGAIGVVPALRSLAGAAPSEVSYAWATPAGPIRLGIDPLTAFFLVPLLGLASVCAVYGRSYLQRGRRGRALGLQAFLLNATVAAMVLVLLARSAVVFLVAWELMTLGSYLLVTGEHQRADIRRAGWVYLVAGHIGVACLFALFLTLGRLSGGLGFDAFAARPPAGAGLAVLVLALAAVGFGAKAGIVPLHVWLPEAHAAAPAHVSALMSGVLIKLGLYGLLRVTTFVPPPRWWGPALIIVGLGGGLAAIALATYQRDLKFALAYSSVENVGIILVGLGAGFWASSRGHATTASLATAGALLHLWNHAAMKGLLFLGAGSLVHAAGTRDLERMGGLLRRMPWTGALVIVGAVAVAGLPPLNGFAGEWLIYLGLLEGGMAAASGAGLLLLLVPAGLALMGAVAVLAFVRVVGIGLLGQPRSPEAHAANESSPWLIAPMLALAGACVAISLAATRVLPLLAAPARQIAGGSVEIGAAAARLQPVVTASWILWAALLAAALLVVGSLRRQPAADETWSCGYLAPGPRMQYTARSFAEILAERLLPPFWRVRVVSTAATSGSLVPAAASLTSDTTDPLTRSAYQPFFDRWARRFSRLRWLQQGVLHVYLLYILLVLVAALGWASARRWWWGGA